jgi:hypothetical protein
MREFPDCELRWTQPKLLKRYFELLCGDDRIGTLRWEKWFGSLATAEASEGQWTFKRAGVPGWDVTGWDVAVRESGSAETIAMFEATVDTFAGVEYWSGAGSLQYRGGQRIRWAQNVRRSRCMWVSVNGLEIAGFSYHSSITSRTEGRLKVSTYGAGLPELPLLVLLGWYLVTPLLA